MTAGELALGVLPGEVVLPVGSEAAGAGGHFVPSGGTEAVRAAAAAPGSRPVVAEAGPGDRPEALAEAGARLVLVRGPPQDAPALCDAVAAAVLPVQDGDAEGQHDAAAVQERRERGFKAVCVDGRGAAFGAAVRRVRTLRRAFLAATKKQLDVPLVVVLDLADGLGPSDVASVLRIGAAAVVLAGAAPPAEKAAALAAATAPAPPPPAAFPGAAPGQDPFVSPRPPGPPRQAHSDWTQRAQAAAPAAAQPGGFSGNWGRPVFADANAPARQGGYVFLDANTGARRDADGAAGGAAPEAKRQRLPESGGAWHRRFGPSFPHSS